MRAVDAKVEFEIPEECDGLQRLSKTLGLSAGTWDLDRPTNHFIGQDTIDTVMM
jgi:hypothetical protein